MQKAVKLCGVDWGQLLHGNWLGVGQELVRHCVNNWAVGQQTVVFLGGCWSSDVLIKNVEKKYKTFCYFYITILRILFTAQDNSSALSVVHASQKVGHPWFNPGEFVNSANLWEFKVIFCCSRYAFPALQTLQVQYGKYISNTLINLLFIS